MANNQRVVIGGVDTQKNVHVATVIDDWGKILDMSPFETTTAGYRQLLSWLRSFGELAKVGVEGVEDVEVNRSNRQMRRRRGKSDTIDVVSAVRSALNGDLTVIPKANDSIGGVHPGATGRARSHRRDRQIPPAHNTPESILERIQEIDAAARSGYFEPFSMRDEAAVIADALAVLS